MLDFKRARWSLVTKERLVLLHPLTPRRLARAPARTMVSATTLAAIAVASVVVNAPSHPRTEEPDLALSAEAPRAPMAVVAVAETSPKPPAADLTCLAKAVYYEARGESEEGQAAVAQVVLNRTHSPEYSHNVCGVVFQGAHRGQCQFSFACNGAMDRPLEPTAWSRARRIALAVFKGTRKAPVGGATSFHVAGEGGSHGHLVARIGGHLFFGGSKA